MLVKEQMFRTMEETKDRLIIEQVISDVNERTR